MERQLYSIYVEGRFIGRPPRRETTRGQSWAYFMKRAELRKRVVQALMDRVSPEQFANVIAMGLQASTTQSTVDAKTGELKKVHIPNWSSIQNSLNLIKEIWGVEASKQLEDVTNNTDDGLSAKQIRERKLELEGRIKELRGRVVETDSIRVEEVGAGASEERSEVPF